MESTYNYKITSAKQINDTFQIILTLNICNLYSIEDPPVVSLSSSGQVQAPVVVTNALSIFYTIIT